MVQPDAGSTPISPGAVPPILVASATAETKAAAADAATPFVSMPLSGQPGHAAPLKQIDPKEFRSNLVNLRAQVEDAREERKWAKREATLGAIATVILTVVVAFAVAGGGFPALVVLPIAALFATFYFGYAAQKWGQAIGLLKQEYETQMDEIDAHIDQAIDPHITNFPNKPLFKAALREWAMTPLPNEEHALESFKKLYKSKGGTKTDRDLEEELKSLPSAKGLLELGRAIKPHVDNIEMVERNFKTAVTEELESIIKFMEAFAPQGTLPGGKTIDELRTLLSRLKDTKLLMTTIDWDDLENLLGTYPNFRDRIENLTKEIEAALQVDKTIRENPAGTAVVTAATK